MSDESGHAAEREQYIDTPFALDTEQQSLDIECGPLNVNMASAATGGVSIIQTGTTLMLVQGMHREDGTKAIVANDLSPEQARELAAELSAAADEAETPERETPENTDSLVDKAVEAIFK